MISLEAFAEELIKLATSPGTAQAMHGAPKSRSGRRPLRVATLLKKESGAVWNATKAVGKALHLNDRGALAGGALVGGGILGGQALAKKYKKHKARNAMIQNLTEQGYFSSLDDM